MRRALRVSAGLLAVSIVASVGMAATAGAQDNQGGDASYLPDAQVRGLPASKYKVVFAKSDCELDTKGGLANSVPGVRGVVNAVVPDINLPGLLCPQNIPKDGTGTATSGIWAAGVYLSSVVTEGVEALLTFDIAGVLEPLVQNVSTKLDQKIAGPLNLRMFALAFAGIVAGFLLLVGGLRRGWGELARVVVLLGVTGLILGNVAGFYRSASELGRELTSAGLGVMGDPGQRPMDPMRDALIADQWQGQQFGKALPPQCVDAAMGALRDDKSVINAVDHAGCHDEAKHASQSSWGRLLGAVAYLVLVVVMAWALLKLAIAIIVGQVALAGAFFFAPIAVPLGVLKGARALFAVWLGALARFIVGMAFNAVMLSVTVIVVTALLQMPADGPWGLFLKLAAATVAAMAMGRFTTHIMEGMERSAHKSTSRAVVGGMAVGAGIGAGAVAAQGIASSHQRADVAAGRVRGRAVNVAERAGGKVTQTGAKLVKATPVAQTIQDRRAGRHTVDTGSGDGQQARPKRWERTPGPSQPTSRHKHHHEPVDVD